MQCLDMTLTNSPHTLEKKKERAKLVLNGLKLVCETMQTKLLWSKDVDMLSKLLSVLQCIYNLAENYTKLYSDTEMGPWIKMSKMYRPLLLDSIRMDIHALFADIIVFTQKLVPFIEETDIKDAIDEAICLNVTFSRFLQDVLIKNKVFHCTIPQPYRRRNTRRSVWNY